MTVLFDALLRWPVESQQTARRNAMVASTALARQRAEREDVEEFFATHPSRVDEDALPAAARVASG